jgi:hypothetical protein
VKVSLKQLKINLMSKNQFKPVADYEFVQNVKRMVANATQDEFFQRHSYPISHDCDNSSIIAMSILQELTDDVSFARGVTKKDKSIYQYYCLHSVEVFCILTEDQRLLKADLTYVAIGDHKKRKEYCARIYEKIKTNISETIS